MRTNFSIPFALLFLGFFEARLALAASCGDKCALQRDKTILTEKLLQPSACDRDALNSLETGFYPFEADVLQEGPTAPSLFLMALCSYHQESRKTSLVDQEKVIDQLQKSVTGGLMPAQKNTAALFEGLSHCRAAGLLHMDDPIDEGEIVPSNDVAKSKKSRRKKDLFCMHRSMAKEAFGEVDWVSFSLSYASSKPGFSLNKRVEEMSSCGKEILRSSFDSYCGEITPLEKGDIKEIAVKASGEILNHYIGRVDPKQAYEPGIPPYSAMMARKLILTDGTLAKSKENFTVLADKNLLLKSSFEQLLSAYGSVSDEGILSPGGPQSYPGRVSALQEIYLDSVSKSQALLDLAERWEKGLFTDDGKKDLRIELEKMRGQLQYQLSFLKGKKDQEGDKGLIGLIDTVTLKIAALADTKGNDNKGLTQSMCALYFCDIRARDPAVFINSCKIDLDPDANKTQFLYEVNPLCDNPKAPALNGVLNDEKKSLVKKICVDAGFPQNFIGVESLPKNQLMGQVNACMSTYFDKKLLDSIKEGPST